MNDDMDVDIEFPERRTSCLKPLINDEPGHTDHAYTDNDQVSEHTSVRHRLD